MVISVWWWWILPILVMPVMKMMSTTAQYGSVERKYTQVLLVYGKLWGTLCLEQGSYSGCVLEVVEECIFTIHPIDAVFILGTICWGQRSLPWQWLAIKEKMPTVRTCDNGTNAGINMLSLKSEPETRRVPSGDIHWWWARDGCIVLYISRHLVERWRLLYGGSEESDEKAFSGPPEPSFQRDLTALDASKGSTDDFLWRLERCDQSSSIQRLSCVLIRAAGIYGCWAWTRCQDDIMTAIRSQSWVNVI